MKKNLQKRSLVAGGVLLAIVASAAPDSPDSKSYVLVKPGQKNLNRFGLSYRMAFNISAKFTDLGGLAIPPGQGANLFTPDGPNGGVLPYNYDDGYVYDDVYNNMHNAPGDPDANPALDNATTFWGVLNQSQIDGNQITMTRTEVVASGESRSEDDPHHGFELTYNRQLGEVGRGHWGIDAAFNYMQLCLGNNKPPTGFIRTSTDTYTLPGGVTEIQPPYEGSYFGVPTIEYPQIPLLQRTPDGEPAVVTTLGTLSGNRKISADIFGFRLGPYIEMPLGDRVSFMLSAGMAAAIVDSEFSFQDVTTGGTLSGRGSHTDVLWGGYVAGSFSVALNEKWSLNAGAQYQDVGRFSQVVGGKRAELDLSRSIFVTLGFSYTF